LALSGYVDAEHLELVRKDGKEANRQRAVNSASATINSHLGGRHAVPVVAGDDEELAAQLEEWALSLALYRLSSGTPGTGSRIGLRWADAMRQLRAIRDGSQVLIGAAPLSDPADRSEGTVEVVGNAGVKRPNSFPPSLFDCERNMIP